MVDVHGADPDGKVHAESRLVGRINVYNLLAAIGAAQALGLSNEVIESGIRNLESVRGVSSVSISGNPSCDVDYAHTDDALENLIRTARELNPRPLITLFVVAVKRPHQASCDGEVTGRLSDLTILPATTARRRPLKSQRHHRGLQKTAGKYLIEPDREKGYGVALDEARSGDMVLLAEKAHENYQILADRTFEFDDREMARSRFARTWF